ncbi:MAG: phosphate propanoyltransferase [Erysipelotrichaceae bacterium]|nr:phosphate propanoyltransferase [Erysipelotrichaceae bacterium]MBQ7223335.1 phosphate propanoyltransferase [Erysipelotrichaceae bacterium]
MSEKFIVETSARHVHVTQETLEKLFGEGYQLTCKKELSQPGQFASNEKVTVRGPRGELKCSILGPCRKLNQIEVSLTEARQLGINALVRESGDIEGTAGCTLVGPCGEVELENGVIAAKRHIHMTVADAANYGVTNGEIVNVKVNTRNGRELVFGDVVVRVSDSYALAMHIDTDESNAAGAPNEGEIIKF